MIVCWTQELDSGAMHTPRRGKKKHNISDPTVMISLRSTTEHDVLADKRIFSNEKRCFTSWDVDKLPALVA